MVNDSDFSWFNLNNYDRYASMSLEDWQWQLQIRTLMHYLINYAPGLKSCFEENLINGIKNGFVGRGSYLCLGFSEAFTQRDAKRSESSVKSITSLQLWKIFKHEFDNKELVEACKHGESFWHKEDCNRELAKLANRPHAINRREILKRRKYSQFEISVDLNATDEVLKEDFSHWLASVRETLKPKDRYTPKVTEIKTKELKNWVKLKCIPYLDLKFMWLYGGNDEHDFRGQMVEKLLFPNDPIKGYDPRDRVRKSTKDWANRIIETNVARIIERQLRRSSTK
ncbi:DUF6387 family protein [Methylomonas sp. BW4-1]|uniref:DUF6387 family protein n=1 Tax=Methylomonas sp. BW4-1 TaxID=3376685 RepID=UPI004041844C